MTVPGHLILAIQDFLVAQPGGKATAAAIVTGFRDLAYASKDIFNALALLS